MTADPLALVRGAHFAATMLASGTVCFMALAIGPRMRMPYDLALLRRRMIFMVWIGLVLAVVTGVMWLVWLASTIFDETLIDVCLHGGALSVLTDTRFGWIWCARLVLAVFLGLLIFDPARKMMSAITAAAFLILPAFVGHAGATPGLRGDVHLASDAAHLLAAGTWLGGLPAFAMLLWTAGQKRNRRWDNLTIEATRRFSILAVVAVGTLLASGIINSWSLLSGARDLWTTDYGRLVAFKAALLAAMIAIASVNKFHLTPRLPARPALRNLQRNSLAEIGIGLCVLVLVGYLGRLQPTTHVHPATPPIPPDAAFTHIHVPEAMADVTINPGRAGRSAVTIRLSREDFTTFAAKDVRLLLDPPAGSGKSLERAAEQQTDGTWMIKEIALAQPGVWTVRVLVIAQTGGTIVLDAPIVIER